MPLPAVVLSVFHGILHFYSSVSIQAQADVPEKRGETRATANRLSVFPFQISGTAAYLYSCHQDVYNRHT